ncbi:hypothetical protein Tco_0286387 [Tanacetum coccineum]
MDLETTQTNAAAKLPLLKQGEYEMWRLRIEQYFQIQDYALWDVIENGNSFKPTTRTTSNADGTSTSMIPVVVDAFIPFKKSNACKRFAFVRFIKVDNIDRLVANLCTIWIERFYLHANVSHFHRERKPSTLSQPSNANESNSSAVMSTSSLVTYTSISSKARSWSIPTEDPSKEVVRQALEHAPSSPSYVPDLMELDDYVPLYVPEPVHPEYLAPSDDDIPVEDQPYAADASPTALSLGYIADFDPEEDEEEDPANYPANGGDDEDDGSSDNDDDVEGDEEDKEEHLALTDSFVVPIVDPVPSAEDTKAFETDESASTPPASPPHIILFSETRPHTITTHQSYAQVPLGCRAAMLRAASLLPPMSSSLPPSILPSPIRPPHTRAAMAQIRVATPSTYHLLLLARTPPLLPIPLPTPSTSRRADIPETDMSPRKRLLLTAPTPSGGGGGGSVDVVLVVAVKLERTSADAVRALKKFVLCRVST